MLLKIFAPLFVFIVLIFISSCATSNITAAGGQDGPVPLLGTLSGDLPVNALSLLPERQQEGAVGYFRSQKQLDEILQAMAASRTVLPAVDFSTQIVLFTRNTVYYNRLRIAQVKREGDTLSILAIETMSARPIVEKVAISLAVIEKNGARYINAPGQNVEISE